MMTIKYFLYAILLLMPMSASAQKLVPVAKAYSQTSVNTAVFRNNSLVTHKGWQYIAFYDADGYLTLGKRKQGKDKWQIERSQYRGKVQDAHNVISIMLDGNGYIHVSFDHHGNALKYCRSVAPYSLKLGDLMPMTGNDEKDVTYPEFYYLKGGDLLFAAINTLRLRGVNPEMALLRSTDKFVTRFAAVEKKAAEQGVDVKTAGLQKLEELYQQVKSEE